jgi:succinylarginine dihydrolase
MSTSTYHEVNFDGLVGPTHHYAGLSSGNRASIQNGGLPANPREAALQGLDKMLALAQRGFKQAVLPPLQRPHLNLLRALGYSGSPVALIQHVARDEPQILSAIYSASAMWVANAATVTPSADTPDGRVHFTPANLNAKFHRSHEHPDTARLLKTIFVDERHFLIHPALPNCPAFGDEGAANHTRLARAHGEPGVGVFVYGRDEFNTDEDLPQAQRFSARQTLQASRVVARQHQINAKRLVCLQQNPKAIDAGVFHNDVISVGHLNVLFHHEDAFLNEEHALWQLQSACIASGFALRSLRVPGAEVSLEEAVKTYLFNSQLLSDAQGRITLVVPQECQESRPVRAYLDRLLARQDVIPEVLSFDLRQSMRNGGGPACLRLRVVLSDEQLASLGARVVLDEALHATLSDWVRRHYRDRLQQADLADPALLTEVQTAYLELNELMQLKGFYSALE